MRRYWLRGVGALGVDHKLGSIAITLRFDLCVEIRFPPGNYHVRIAVGDAHGTDFQRTAAAGTGRKPKVGSAILCFSGQDARTVYFDHGNYNTIATNITPRVYLDR